MVDRYTDQSRGFAFISFVDKESRDKASAVKDQIIDGKQVEVKLATRKAEGEGKEGEEAVEQESEDVAAVEVEVTENQLKPDYSNTDKKLFVGGLAPDTKEQDLIQYFSRFGHVTSAVIKYDADSNRSRGFGFVTFGDLDSYNKALDKGKYQVILGKRVELKGYSAGPAANVAETTQATTNEDILARISNSTKRYSNRSFGDVYNEYWDSSQSKGGRRKN